MFKKKQKNQKKKRNKISYVDIKEKDLEYISKSFLKFLKNNKKNNNFYNLIIGKMGLFGIFDMNGPDEIYTKFKYLRRMNDSLYDGYIKDQEEVRRIYQKFCDSNDYGAKKIDVDPEKFDLILKNNFHLYLDNVDKISHCFLKMFTKYGTKNLVWNYFSNKFEGEGVKYYDIIQFHDNLPIDNLFGCKYMGIYLCSRILEYCDQAGIAIKKKLSTNYTSFVLNLDMVEGNVSSRKSEIFIPLIRSHTLGIKKFLFNIITIGEVKGLSINK